MSTEANPPTKQLQPVHIITGLVTRLQVQCDVRSEALTDWLLKLMLAGAKFPGFWSGEIIPPGSVPPPEWQLVQRFSSLEEAREWQQSAVRQSILDEARSLTESNGLTVTEEIAEHGTSGSVATAIVSYLTPGLEDSYWKWQAKIQSAQARYHGYAGIYFQPPAPGREGQWTTLLRFNTPEDLENWFSSEERMSLLEESKELVRECHIQPLTSSFPGWFPIDPQTNKEIPRWKTALLVLIGLYPILAILRYAFIPLLVGLHHELARAIGCIASVSLVTWIAMPSFIKLFEWWLFPKNDKDRSIHIRGAAVAILLFICEVFVVGLLLPG